jgi:hypothetical protein
LGMFLMFHKQEKYLGNIFHSKIYVLILTKNVLGYILGKFFCNLFGSPWYLGRYLGTAASSYVEQSLIEWKSREFCLFGKIVHFLFFY